MRSSARSFAAPRSGDFVDVIRKRIDQRDARVGADSFDRDLVGVPSENLDADWRETRPSD
jgi:hypothetical protein